MHIPNRDIATGEASDLVLTRMGTVLADVSAPKKMLIADVIPICGIWWSDTIPPKGR